MSGQGNIREGMEVYGAGDRLLGRVERVHGDGFDAAGQHYRRDSVARIAQNRVYVKGAGVAEAGATGATEGEIRIPVVEEQLQVGKREVDLGEVEIRRRVVEEERMVPVTLRHEEVTVERVDAVDRPLRAGEEAFEEGVIRVPVRGEEAVIAKEAVVTGEVVVEKTATAEERQVGDTVRRTEVDVDDTTPHHRTGYAAGTDTRYANRSFEEVEPELRRQHLASGGTDDWAQLREEVRTGFTRARGR